MLGKHLIGIGSMSSPDFEEFVRIHVWRERINLITNLEKELNSYSAPPDYWASDVTRYLTTMRAALTMPDYVVPVDLQAHRTVDEARKLSQSLVVKFGRLLRDWPDIIDAARRLRARGIRVAAAVSR
jgi:hypothetical protein